MGAATIYEGNGFIIVKPSIENPYAFFRGGNDTYGSYNSAVNLTRQAGKELSNITKQITKNNNNSIQNNINNLINEVIKNEKSKEKYFLSELRKKLSDEDVELLNQNFANGTDIINRVINGGDNFNEIIFTFGALINDMNYFIAKQKMLLDAINSETIKIKGKNYTINRYRNNLKKYDDFLAKYFNPNSKNGAINKGYKQCIDEKLAELNIAEEIRDKMTAIIIPFALREMYDEKGSGQQAKYDEEQFSKSIDNILNIMKKGGKTIDKTILDTIDSVVTKIGKQDNNNDDKKYVKIRAVIKTRTDNTKKRSFLAELEPILFSKLYGELSEKNNATIDITLSMPISEQSQETSEQSQEVLEKANMVLEKAEEQVSKQIESAERLKALSNWVNASVTVKDYLKFFDNGNVVQYEGVTKTPNSFADALENLNLSNSDNFKNALNCFRWLSLQMNVGSKPDSVPNFLDALKGLAPLFMFDQENFITAINSQIQQTVNLCLFNNSYVPLSVFLEEQQKAMEINKEINSNIKAKFILRSAKKKKTPSANEQHWFENQQAGLEYKPRVIIDIPNKKSFVLDIGGK